MYYPYKDDDENEDRIDSMYRGHMRGYTYMGGGYYSNNGCGSDQYISYNSDGSYEWHSSM